MASATDQQDASTPPLRPSAGAASPQTPAARRKVAVLIAGALVAIFALAGLADTLGAFAPSAQYHNGQRAHAGVYVLALSIAPTPIVVGKDTQFTVTVTDEQGRPIGGVDVRYQFSMPAMEMTPLERRASAGARGGTYVATTTLDMVGVWMARVVVTPPGGASAHADFTVAVR